MTDDLETLYDDVQIALAEDELEDAIQTLGEMTATASNDPRTLEARGDVALYQGNSEEAEQYYQRLLDEAPDNEWKGVANMSLGMLCSEAGEPDRARQHFTQSVELFNAAGATRRTINAHVVLAELDDHNGNYDAVVESLQAARSRIAGADAPDEFEVEAANICQFLGSCYRQLGELELAKEVLQEALSRFEILEDPGECANTLDALGVVEQIQGQYASAEELHLKAVAINESIKYDIGLSINYGNLTMLNIHRREYEAATAWAQKAHEIDLANGNENGTAHFYLLRGEIEFERGNLSESERLLQRSAELYEECGDAEDKLCVQSKLAALYRLQGRLAEASVINEQLLQTAETMGHLDGIAAILDELAHVRKAQGDVNEARALWNRSLQLFRELNSARMIEEVEANLTTL